MVKTGKDLEFDSYKIAHDLEPLPLITWTIHDKPPQRGQMDRFNTKVPPTLRTTSVSVVTPNGMVFTGISACSEADVFSKKDGFNRAYGRACQKYVAFKRGRLEKPDFIIKDMGMDIKEIGRWVTHHAYEMKMDFLKSVYAKRIRKGLGSFTLPD
jgi:hypothetical protein